MPKYKLVDCGPIETATSKKGSQYVRKFLYLLKLDAAGRAAGSEDVMLTGDLINNVADAKSGDMVFIDFDKSGYAVDVRVFPAGEGK